MSTTPDVHVPQNRADGGRGPANVQALPGKPWTTTLEKRVAEAESNLGAGRKRLIREILDHPEDTYFLSSRALAKHYDVDTATIVRTIQALGYERFADFSADLRSHFITRITPYAVMKS